MEQSSERKNNTLTKPLYPEEKQFKSINHITSTKNITSISRIHNIEVVPKMREDLER